MDRLFLEFRANIDSIILLLVFFRNSGEAILGTQRYFQCIFFLSFVHISGEAILGTQRYFQCIFFLSFFRNSGEAILGTQRYLKRSIKKTLEKKHWQTI